MIKDITSYRLEHLMLFTQETYIRLFEIYNRDIFPTQGFVLLLSAGVVYFLIKPSPLGNRLVSWILGMFWISIASIYHLKHFRPINWTAVYFGGLFVFEALLIIIFGGVLGWLQFRVDKSIKAKLATGIFLMTYFWPILQMMITDRTWNQLQLFGWGATETAIGTGAILLLASPRWWVGALLWIPIFGWLLVSALISFAFP